MANNSSHQAQDIQESADEVGYIGENWFCFEEVIPDGSLIKCGAYERLCFPCWVVDCEDVSKVQQFRDIGVDFLLWMLDEDSEIAQNVEVKTCRKACRTRNMAVEIYSDFKTRYPGWYMKTKCDILIYYMLDEDNRANDKVLIVPMKKLREYVDSSRQAHRFWYALSEPDKRTNKENFLYLVKIDAILANVDGAFVIPADGEYDLQKSNLLRQKGMLSD